MTPSYGFNALHPTHITGLFSVPPPSPSCHDPIIQSHTLVAVLCQPASCLPLLDPGVSNNATLLLPQRQTAPQKISSQISHPWVFRHHDHKFEWTIKEFWEWCKGVAQEWEYNVDMTMIGHAQEKDERGQDEELGGASQVAAFKRLEGEPWAMTCEEKSSRKWGRYVCSVGSHIEKEEVDQ
ncbi:hypothetical protein DFH29DRAFT_883593 [Suillus ampliporus]|nr:hypothetical protein DFH29DRAFT_883593 [Suillus ampliporus]